MSILRTCLFIPAIWHRNIHTQNISLPPAKTGGVAQWSGGCLPSKSPISVNNGPSHLSVNSLTLQVHQLRTRYNGDGVDIGIRIGGGWAPDGRHWLGYLFMIML